MILKIAFKKIFNDLKEYFITEEYYPSFDFKDFISDNLIPYYIDFGWTLRKGHFDHFDENGIPVKMYANYGKQYNPTRIAAYALVNWNEYLKTKDKINLEIFLKQANWFVDNSEEHNGVYSWYYHFDHYDLKAPWLSAVAHGEALSILTRAFLLTNDNIYKDIIDKSINIFNLNLIEGGVKAEFPDNSLCFEEYPSKTNPHVLNGFIFAIFGLYDVCTLINNDNIELNNLLDEAFNGLTNNLNKYDDGFWSLYHYPDETVVNTTTTYYHNLHVSLLEALYLLTGEDIYEQYHHKWKAYYNNILNRLYAMYKKLIYRYYFPAKH